MIKKLAIGIVAVIGIALLIYLEVNSTDPIGPGNVALIVIGAVVLVMGFYVDFKEVYRDITAFFRGRAHERRRGAELPEPDLAGDQSGRALPPSFEYDVFISYSHADEDWVWETLVPAIQKENLSYCIDEESFSGGVPLIVNMEEGVMSSRHTVAVLSPAYMARKPAIFETLLALTQDPAGEQPRLIPIMIADCFDLLRPYLKMRWIYKMRNPRETLRNMPRLIADLRAESAPKDAQTESEQEASWPPRIYVPPPGGTLPPWFVPRPGEAEKVLKALGVLDDEAEASLASAPRHPVALTAALQGMGGVGKTVLAAWLIREERVRARWPDGVLWATLGPDATGVAAADPWLLRWGRELGADLGPYATPELRASVLAGLLAGQEVLLVADDVWDAAPARVLFECSAASCGCLLTTRQLAIAQTLDPDPVRVDVMSEAESLKLLAERAGEGMARVSDAQAAELCRRLGYLPLAVGLAGAALAGGTPATEFLEALEARQGTLAMLDLGEAASRLESARICFEISVEGLPTDVARGRYALLGVLAPEAPFGIPEAAIAWGVKADDPIIAPTLRLLARHALIEPLADTSGRYRQHALLREHALGRLDTETRRDAEQRHAGSYLALVKRYDAARNWSGIDAIHPQAYAALERAQRACAEGASTPAEEAAVARRVVGELVQALSLNYWERRYLWSLMASWNALALGHCRQLGDRGGAANCIKSLGHVARRQANYAGARKLYGEAFPIYREIGDRKGEADCIRVLGHVARMQADYAGARKLYEEALAIYREIGNRLGTANCVRVLGHVALRQADYAGARKLYEEALEVYREIGNRLGAANCIKSLGSVARRQAEYEEAHGAYEEALEIYREVEDRLGAANCIRVLGHVALEQDEYEEARGAYEEALAIYREIGDRLGAANCTRSLGDVARRHDHTAGARKLYGEALTISREIGDRMGVADCLQSLGFLEMALHRPQEARMRFLDALELHVGIGARRDAAIDHRQLGLLFKATGDLGAAREHLTVALALFEAIGVAYDEDAVRKELEALSQPPEGSKPSGGSYR